MIDRTKSRRMDHVYCAYVSQRCMTRLGYWQTWAEYRYSGNANPAYNLELGAPLNEPMSIGAIIYSQNRIDSDIRTRRLM